MFDYTIYRTFSIKGHEIILKHYYDRDPDHLGESKGFTVEIEENPDSYSHDELGLLVENVHFSFGFDFIYEDHADELYSQLEKILEDCERKDSLTKELTPFLKFDCTFLTFDESNTLTPEERLSEDRKDLCDLLEHIETVPSTKF